jgi:sporulation protein YlmC with PRC-barrel domain
MPTTTGHTTSIRATRAIGTDVYNVDGEKIGKVEDIILDKTDNSIMFAVVGFGGFLGIGEKYHPVPWATLDYSTDTGGYIVPFTKDELKAAPADTISELTKEDGRWARNEAYTYYKVDPYWN